MSNTGGKKYETYTQAVEAACRGDQEAFTFLYESTYRDKYFIAWKYMRREEDAQDVLQDAYMKAWENLATLKEPEKFPGWLSMIVANTALNALKKKKPLPFSALEQTTEEGDTFEFEEEDWRKEYQPEHAYTDKETSELLKEMLDALSDEQRFCMLMHYVEEIPTNQIAEMIGCTKNTVTSRLNYGRKNLKAKAEELEKKGYSLYSIAPLPLLLLLLRTQARTAQVAIPALNTAEAASLTLSGGSAGSAATPAASTASNASSTSATITSTSASTGASSAGASGTTASPGAATASVTAATAAATAAAGMALGTKIAIGAIVLALLGGGGLAAAKLLSSGTRSQVETGVTASSGTALEAELLADQTPMKWVVSKHTSYEEGTGKVRQIETSQYNDLGQMVLQEVTDSEGNVTNIYTYEYDGNGNQIRSVSENKEYNRVYESHMKYDAENRMIYRESLDEDGSVSGYSNYEYNADGSYKETHYSHNGFRDEILYDTSGKRVHSFVYHVAGDGSQGFDVEHQGKLSQEYIYETVDHLDHLPPQLEGTEITRRVFIPSDSEPQIIMYECHLYDEEGRSLLYATCSMTNNWLWNITYYEVDEDEDGRTVRATYERQQPDGSMLTGISGEYEYIRVPDYDAAD